MRRLVVIVMLVAAAAATTGGVAATRARGTLSPARPAASGPLARSHASSGVVQPQPPPGRCRARGSAAAVLPDPRCTPGAIDPAVTQADLPRTICRAGYSAGVRPPESITEREKRASMAAYGDRGSMRAYEYDHLVSLELGGAPNDARNLWPEPGASPNVKDRLENRLHRLVCDGQLSLAAAQLAIARDWTAAARRYLG